MPELPEVETIRSDLDSFLKRKKIDYLEVRLERIIDSRLKAFLPDRKVAKIGRLGKMIVFYFVGSPEMMLVHLKMTGQLIYKKGQKMISGGHSDGQGIERLPNRHTRAIIRFTDKSRLYFNDLRTFGYIKLADDGDLAKISQSLGPDAFNDQLMIKDYNRKIRSRKTNIKALLLNQSFISGLGNIYTDEALFLSGIRPFRKADSLGEKEVSGLIRSIKPLLRKAIKYRGTTFNDFVDSEGKKGGFLKMLNVYGRGGQPCRRCKSLIKKIKVAGRGTNYCPVCQK